MIVHVFPSYPRGTGRPLATYVLDLKHENPGEALGPYVRRSEDKIEWDRTVNTSADTAAAAISAIEEHNAQNLNWHSKSRWVHVVISFPQGECPTRTQMEEIEDRLMGTVGFGDHPRVSALHKPDGKEVDNWHLHVAVSRIDPTTLKAEHPWRNWYSLQYEAGILESELGLTHEKKNVRWAQREEIDLLARNRQFDGRALDEFQVRQEKGHTQDREFSRETSAPKIPETKHEFSRVQRPMPHKLSAAAFASQIASDMHQTLPPGHDSFMLQCPNGSEHAHGDKNRSLHVWEDRSGGHAYCQTGC